MPRLYDYSKDKKLTMSVFGTYDAPACRGSEVTSRQMWPGPTDFLSGRQHQFEMYSEKGVSPYRNEFADPVYDWLVENIAGEWNWREEEVNHGHSVATEVWIEDPSEHDAFLAAWSDRFKVYERGMERDLKVRETMVSAPRL